MKLSLPLTLVLLLSMPQGADAFLWGVWDFLVGIFCSIPLLNLLCPPPGPPGTRFKIRGWDEEGYLYNIWADAGEGSITPGAKAAYHMEFQNAHNLLAKSGLRPGAKNTTIMYNLTDLVHDPDTHMMVAVYGWSKNPLKEWYIVESWEGERPPSFGLWPFFHCRKETITCNGGQYDIYKTWRGPFPAPSVEGDTQFEQYWSVRREPRTSGTINTQIHFDAFDRHFEHLGYLYEVTMVTEAYNGRSQGTGSAHYSSLEMIAGLRHAYGGGTELGMCEGDCSNDDDCLEDLYCSHNDGPDGVKVPWCTGSRKDEIWDYCTTAVRNEVKNPDKLLNICEGNCDSDENCHQGLYCSHNDGQDGPRVPGCGGSRRDEDDVWDYCTMIPSINVAEGKLTNQSSTHTSHNSSKAVDGNTSGAWPAAASTLNDENAWWTVDLGGAHNLKGVTVWRCNDCSQSRLGKFLLEYRGAANEVLIAEVVTWPDHAIVSIYIPLEHDSVYSVMIQQQNETEALSLAEVQVWRN